MKGGSLSAAFAVLGAPILLVWNIAIAITSKRGAFEDGSLGFGEFVGLAISSMFYWLCAFLFLWHIGLAFERYVMGDKTIEMPKSRSELDGDDVEPHQHWSVAVYVTGMGMLILGLTIRAGGA